MSIYPQIEPFKGNKLQYQNLMAPYPGMQFQGAIQAPVSSKYEGGDQEEI